MYSLIARSWLAMIAAALAPGLGAQPAVLNKAWLGQWQLAQKPAGWQGADSLQISNGDGWMANGLHCDPVYDGTVTQQAITERLRATRAWQLAPEHWPAGTQTTQLVGLNREFDEAEAALRGLPAGNYRRVRLGGAEGCASRDDVFYVITGAQRIFELRFPLNSLGVGVAVYQLRGR
ncbi:MAG: hypothetical protein HYX47_15040 [Burkholderiales bacterium]|nr:hypothetical protein [Burkholderiales bacterium]